MPAKIAALWRALRADRRAVTALEYGLIASLVALVIISSLTLMGGHMSTVFNHVATTL